MNLVEYIGRRLISLVGVMIGVTAIVFFAAHSVPADPVALILGDLFTATPEELARIRAELGLNLPLPVQYVLFLKNLLLGNWGTSFRTNRPVLVDLSYYFPATLELALFALLIAILVGVPLGIIAAVRQNKWSDHVLRVFALGGVAMPVFWFGLVLQLIFYSWLGILPVGGRVSQTVLQSYPLHSITGLYIVDALIQGDWPVLQNALWHMLLPAVALGYRAVGWIMRISRSAMLEVFRQDYIRTARAFGFPNSKIITKYALKNALIPVLTVTGLTFGQLLQGSVLVETVFNWPGMGLYTYSAITYFDYPGLLGVTVLASLVYVGANLVVDVLYTRVDPRIRF